MAPSAPRGGNAVVRQDDSSTESTQSIKRFGPIFYRSETMDQVVNQLRLAAASCSTVLLTGGSGTGKSFGAIALYGASTRARNPFVTVDCAGLPATVIESELYGHERGAFTGAVAARVGRLEAAHGGTLFLEEVGDLPLAVQAKLHRFLDRHEFERVGSNETRRADVRVIAATLKDLDRLVEEGRFRDDLLFRINVVPIRMPLLRERSADIPLLAEKFCNDYATKNNRHPVRLSDSAVTRLLEYSWPGNIRELNNAIERTLTLSPTDVVDADQLALPRERVVSVPRVCAAQSRRGGPKPRDINWELYEGLRGDRQNMDDIARALGVSRATLFRRLKFRDRLATS